MKLYCDNDVIHKLATFDLHAEALAALGLGARDVFVLPTARYFFCAHKPAKGEIKFGAPVFGRIVAILDAVSVIEEAPPPEYERLLAGIPGIDQGEAILFGVAAANQGTLVATADRKSLLALARTPRAPRWSIPWRGA